MPWALSVLPQCLRYFERLSRASSETNSVNFLVFQSFQEQKNLNLSWYGKLSSVAHYEAGVTRGTMKDVFISDWRVDLASQSKMHFYNRIKEEFGEEQYLNLKSRQSRTSITKFRSSSHDLMIERGRYTRETGVWPRACRFCCDKDLVYGFECLPFFEGTIIENEEHCLTECPMYHSVRSSLSEDLESLLLQRKYKEIMNSAHIEELGKFLSTCHRIRNPKKTPTSSSTTPNC